MKGTFLPADRDAGCFKINSHVSRRAAGSSLEKNVELPQ